ncbi:MAG: GNAT family N-acetyltransferase [Candidatus Heimdallarchaeota archaeon]|nr:GNAT family N-acetyltransferase [Candidatus Heimdallarchaeota archaeon]
MIESDELVLRNFKPGDAGLFANYRNDPQVARFQTWKTDIDLKYALRFIKQMNEIPLFEYDKGEWSQIAIALKESDRLIGDIGIQIQDPAFGNIEFGITLSRKFQQRGYAFKSITLLFDYLFAKNTHRIYAVTDYQNTSSIKLLKKLGMREEGYYIESYYDQRTKRWRDEMRFALLNREWKNRESG